MNVIITGAGKGIGYEMVKYCIEKKFTNIFALSKNTMQLDKLKNESRPNENLHIINFDLQNIENYSEIESIIRLSTSKIDYLINNAGILVNKPFEIIQLIDFIDSYNINVFSSFFLIQKLLSLLKDGSIINISSMGAIQGSSKYAGLSVYSSSKSALLTLTEVLALELKKYNISCNALALGAVQTEMLSKAFPEYQAQTTPNEMARFIIDFALNSSKIINGKIIQVSNSNP